MIRSDNSVSTAVTHDTTSSVADTLLTSNMLLNLQKQSVLAASLQQSGSTANLLTIQEANAETSDQQSSNLRGASDWLDESDCREFRIHIGPVSQVAISQDGLFIFTAGSDGVLYMLTTSRRGKEMMTMPHSASITEDKFLLIDKSKIQNLRSKLNEAKVTIEIAKKDSELALAKVTNNKDKIILDLDSRMKKEVQQRDDTIIQGRLDYINLNNMKKEEIEAIQKQCSQTIAEIELQYERKLAHESLYLEKMRQAYDEYVVHSKIDLSEVQQKAEKRIIEINEEKANTLKEAEKQKSTVLQYFEYVKLRNNEILVDLEDKQEDERFNVSLNNFKINYVFL
jgi:hypothetical protein